MSSTKILCSDILPRIFTKVAPLSSFASHNLLKTKQISRILRHRAQATELSEYDPVRAHRALRLASWPWRSYLKRRLQSCRLVKQTRRSVSALARWGFDSPAAGDSG